ncbi:MAG: hypothetical protein FWE41_01835 [Coriobacteriia bacterium]|nr:hypothetical protein [Coriobacteriia bacterium]MCL2749582.1 hypothetical protein [Coriobacteriia bacterium]
MGSSDSIVTARVPREIRELGDAVLKRIDSTVTELVNSAFEYVIKTGELPNSQDQFNPEEKIIRKFSSSDEKSIFLLSLKETSLPVSEEYVSLSAKDIKSLRLAERYEV